MNTLILTADGEITGIKPVKSLGDALRATPEGLFRSAYFFVTGENPQQIQDSIAKESIELTGPMTVVHSIRRASDLLLEECGYDGLEIQLEVEGKRVPELPERDRLLELLKNEKTLVLVDGKPYRPNQEVFGFQNVYDDTTRFVEALKSMGIGNDAMYILATPDEIAIEVHPGVFGSDSYRQLARMYRALIGRIAGIKKGERGLFKTTDLTILPETALATAPVLVPGSVHPGLHRPKVGVSQSHFAYGPAAFSDYCGKKRTLDECVKEVRSWLKFLESEKEPIQRLKDLFSGLATNLTETPEAPVSQTVNSGRATPSPVSTPGSSDTRHFRSIKLEIQELLPALPPLNSIIPAPGPELNRSLGGGFSQRGLHLFVGTREEGKAAFLLALALQTAARVPVLFLSGEHTISELTLRAISWISRQPATENILRSIGTGVEAQATRQKWQQTLATTAGVLPENLYVRGSESSVRMNVPDDIVELLKILPANAGGQVVFLESLAADKISESFFVQLRQLANSYHFTVFASIHLDAASFPRPHLIEGPDLEILSRYQAQFDSILHLTSDRLNLRRFIAMLHGKADPPVVEKLENQLLQTTGGARFRQDTYSFLRVLHARGGSRRLILSLYQRDLGRFWEGPSLPVSRP